MKFTKMLTYYKNDILSDLQHQRKKKLKKTNHVRQKCETKQSRWWPPTKEPNEVENNEHTSNREHKHQRETQVAREKNK